MGEAFFKSFSPGAIRTTRAVSGTVIETSVPSSAVNRTTVPLISLTAPIRRLALAAGCACCPDAAATQIGGREKAKTLPAQSAIAKIRFVFALIRVLFLIINLHGHPD